ncbi:zinc finger protein 646-like isoform X2 [Hippoglossus hippoglossus]|uniref:zinc finger protein 646-like isoform X2 n=1 Tax=Hippoglossus hippoglossus TaxID=8267 RepID=UPI00148B8EDF|nr:zinc finger protein 646-like isoform X2 [Hippoglossus hippoglossus]
MYARTNTGSAHGDFQDRNGVNYVTSTETFGHCSQLFWKKDPNDSGPSSTISWCDQLPSSSAALTTSSLSAASLTTSSLSLDSRAPAPATTTVPDDLESDERPYICDMCTCTYKHASSLLNHKLTHKTGDFRCDFCSKPYTNYMSLRNHMRIHGQKRYVCDLCGKAFRLARYLRNHQRIHDDGPNRFDCPSCCKSYRTMLELAQHRCTAATTNQNRFNCPSCFKSYRTMLDLAQHRCSAAAKNQSGSRRSNFGVTPRRQQQRQNNANAMMQQQHAGHGRQESLPSHCVSPMSQGGQGGNVASQSVPDPHQGRPSSVSSQSSQQSMRSSSSNKHVSSSSAAPSSSYSLLQPLVPEVKEMSLGYTRLSANPMPKHQDTFSLAPQRPLTTINPIGHSLHPNGAPTLKPSPVPRTIQAMPWEQRSLYNQ